MPMKLGMINSAWSQAGMPTEYGLRKTKELGFDAIDIFTDPLEIDITERVKIRKECAQLGLPIVSLPVVAFGLIDLNPAVRKFHEHRVRAFLDLAYEYEARNLLLVLGEYVWNREVVPAESQWSWAVESTRRLGERAGELGLEITIELEPFPLSLVNNMETMIQFLDDVACPAVLANLDISHLVLAKIPPTDVQRLAGRVGHVHFSDCDGRVHGDLPPGRGVIDFAPYLAALKALRLDATVSIELEYAPNPDQIVDWVAEAYRETARLMAAAGLRN